MAETTSSPCRPTTRRLYTWEIDQARLVFGGALNYQRIRIHECATWVNTLDRIGRKLKGMPAPETNNAVTLGNHIFFPLRLPLELPATDHPLFHQMGWLIHELTHCWQYQRMGWKYLFLALKAQLRLRERAYDFGGAAAISKSPTVEKKLIRYNLEQQGEIARQYYEHVRRGEDTLAWQPLVEEFQRLA